ncbi:hypothetical protein BDW62DRAFT_191384 [Aspergillus aurantiobrunneus]
MTSDSSDDCPASSSPSCNFLCPAGGTWYACTDPPYFVGCCASDPCTNVSPRSTSPCPATGLYPASFNPAIFDSFLPNTCIGEENANWYTCNFTDPPFLGCCLSNPCAEGECPSDDLVQAAWSSAGGGEDQLQLFRDERAPDDNNGLSRGAIAGIVIGAVAGLVAILALGWFFLRRRRRIKTTRNEQGHGQSLPVVGNQHSYTASPYQGSHISSPPGTTGGKANYPSGSSTGFSLPSLSPHLPSESGRPPSEMHSVSESDDAAQQRLSSQTYGLGLFGAQKPATIQEMDTSTELYELEGQSRT